MQEVFDSFIRGNVTDCVRTFKDGIQARFTYDEKAYTMKKINMEWDITTLKEYAPPSSPKSAAIVIPKFHQL